MRDVPHIIDVHDDLERARETTDEDVAAELEEVEALLERYADRDQADPEGALEVIENELLELESKTEGTAATYVRAARNRVHTYREARSDAVDGVSVLEANVRHADAGARFDGEEGEGEATEFRVSLTNEKPRVETVTVLLRFFRGEGEATSQSTETVSIGPNEQKTITVVTEVPEATEYFAVDLERVGEATQ